MKRTEKQATLIRSLLFFVFIASLIYMAQPIYVVKEWGKTPLESEVIGEYERILIPFEKLNREYKYLISSKVHWGRRQIKKWQKQFPKDLLWITGRNTEEETLWIFSNSEISEIESLLKRVRIVNPNQQKGL